MRKANAHNDAFKAVKLEKRLKQQSVVWVLSDCPSEMTEVPLITELAENGDWDGNSPSIFLYTDPRLSESGKKLFSRGRGEKITLGEGRMSVELTKKRDYGRVPNLDVEGGFFKYHLDNVNTGRVVEFEASFANRGGERRTKRVVIAAVESMEFAARFLVADLVGISAVVLNAFHAGGMGNGLNFAGAWPFHIAAALGAKRLVADNESVARFCTINCLTYAEEAWKRYEKALVQYPYLKDLPETEIKDSGVRVGEGLYNLPLSLYRIGVKDESASPVCTTITFEDMSAEVVSAWEDSEKLSEVPYHFKNLLMRRERSFNGWNAKYIPWSGRSMVQKGLQGRTVILKRDRSIVYEPLYSGPWVFSGTVMARSGLRFSVKDVLEDGICLCLPLDADFADTVAIAERTRIKGDQFLLSKFIGIAHFEMPLEWFEDGSVEVE